MKKKSGGRASLKESGEMKKERGVEKDHEGEILEIEVMTGLSEKKVR